MNSSSDSGRKPSAPIRILMLEHESADIELTDRALVREGLLVELDVAKTRPEFEQKLNTNTYDLVLADFRLPGWTGLDALSEIQKLGLNLPLVLVTGTLGEEKAVECIRLGVSDYVLKNQLGRLPVAIHRALEQKDLREERAGHARALEESAANFRFLFAHNPIPMLVMDSASLLYLEVNDAALRQYGYSREEFLRLHATDIRTSEEADRLREYLLNKTNDPPNAGTWHHRTKAGRTIDVEIISHEMDFQGRPALLIAALNVTEKLALESQLRQAQKFEAIGQLAGGIAHDFNNMLGAILGWVELGVEDTPANTQLQTYFLKIRHQADRAAALTRQLLAFARRQILEPRNVNLNSIIRDVIALLGKIIGSNIELRLLLAEDLPSVKVDPTQAEQIIMNLCLNARDAMPNGGELELQTSSLEVTPEMCTGHKYASPGPHVRFSVRDTGTGIDPANLERIFEPFFTTKDMGKGTGLGLATVYGIVKQHGGYLNVGSKLGEGTRFEIFFPVAAQTKQDEPVVASPQSVRGGKETILLAEDHDGLREIASATLTSLGYQVRLARDGEQAVEDFRLHLGEIALVILDVVLPKLGGPEAFARMCAYQPDVPVLFVTGYSPDAEVLRAVQERRHPLLQKPYGPRELALKVREALDGRAKPAASGDTVAPVPENVAGFKAPG